MDPNFVTGWQRDDIAGSYECFRRAKVGSDSGVPAEVESGSQKRFSSSTRLRDRFLRYNAVSRCSSGDGVGIFSGTIRHPHGAVGELDAAEERFHVGDTDRLTTRLVNLNVTSCTSVVFCRAERHIHRD